jgi:hypothetical protein
MNILSDRLFEARDTVECSDASPVTDELDFFQGLIASLLVPAQ